MSRSQHVPFVLAVSIPALAAALLCLRQLRSVPASMVAWVAIGFLASSLVYLPHVSLDVGDGPLDTAHLVYGPASRLVFGVALLLGALRVALPRVLRRPSGAIAVAVAVAALIDVALHFMTTDGLPGGIRSLRSLEAIQTVCNLAASYAAWRMFVLTRRPFALAYLGFAATMGVSGLLFLGATPWSDRWWVAHVGLAVAGSILVSVTAIEVFRRRKVGAAVRMDMLELVAEPMLRGIGDGIAVIDVAERLVVFTERARELTGWDWDEAERQIPNVVAATRHRTFIAGTENEHLEAEEVTLETVIGLVRAFVIRDVEPAVRLQAAQQELVRLASIDEDTGALSPARFAGRIDQALAAEATSSAPMAVGVLDIGLKDLGALRTAIGPARTRAALRALVTRLSELIGETEAVARLASDRIGVVMTNKTASAIALRSDLLLRSFDTPIDGDGTRVHLSADAGLAIFPDDSLSADGLLEHAELALESARRDPSKRLVLFQPVMSLAAHEQIQTEGELRSGLEGGELVLHYQPVIDLSSGALSSVEALVRWEHPTRGLVPPDRFIGVAEAAGLSNRLGEIVLRSAIAQLRDWQDRGIAVPRVWINVSGHQLRDNRFARLVSDVLSEAQLDPQCLGIELTETVLLGDEGAPVLAEIRRSGIDVRLDDFGTGWASLSYLTTFPLDGIKLDRSLVAGLGRPVGPGGRGNETLIASAIAIAHSFGMTVVAEGVETAEHASMLRLLGADLGQGYWWSRPLAPDELAAWLGSEPSKDRAPDLELVIGGRASDQASLSVAAHDMLSGVASLAWISDVLAQGSGLDQGERSELVSRARDEAQRMSDILKLFIGGRVEHAVDMRRPKRSDN